MGRPNRRPGPSDCNQTFVTHEVASWTRQPQRQRDGYRAAAPMVPAPGIGTAGHDRSEAFGVVPVEVTEALLDEFHLLADRREHGFMVEHVMELPATS